MIALGRLNLTSRIMNAAGPWASTAEQLTALYASGAGAVVTKTFTLRASAGNAEPNTYFTPHFSLNSVGLKNKGAAYFIAARRSLGHDKPIIASIAEHTPEALTELAQLAADGGFDALELNLSCPNIATKEPVAYDPKQLDALLNMFFKRVALPVGVKLPPFVTRSHVAEAAAVLARYPLNHLVAINTYPLAAAYTQNEPAIKPNKGVGGLGGAYLKPIALAHVLLLRECLPGIPIIAVGGISTARDVQDFDRAGAAAFQVGTAIQAKGPEVMRELAAVLRPPGRAATIEIS